MFESRGRQNLKQKKKNISKIINFSQSLFSGGNFLNMKITNQKNYRFHIISFCLCSNFCCSQSEPITNFFIVKLRQALAQARVSKNLSRRCKARVRGWSCKGGLCIIFVSSFYLFILFVHFILFCFILFY